ncbi:dynein heavy chain, partial [Kipferlia bialata]
REIGRIGSVVNVRLPGSPTPTPTLVTAPLHSAAVSVRTCLDMGSCAIVSGPGVCGKGTAVRLAVADKYRAVEIPCSVGTSAKDFVAAVVAHTMPSTLPDGSPVLSASPPLCVVLRDADVVPADEYGTVPLLACLWGLIAHGNIVVDHSDGPKVCGVRGVHVVLTVRDSGRESISSRLASRCETVHLPAMVKSDIAGIVSSHLSHALSLCPSAAVLATDTALLRRMSMCMAETARPVASVVGRERDKAEEAATSSIRALESGLLPPYTRQVSPVQPVVVQAVLPTLQVLIRWAEVAASLLALPPSPALSQADCLALSGVLVLGAPCQSKALSAGVVKALSDTLRTHKFHTSVLEREQRERERGSNGKRSAAPAATTTFDRVLSCMSSDTLQTLAVQAVQVNATPRAPRPISTEAYMQRLGDVRECILRHTPRCAQPDTPGLALLTSHLETGLYDAGSAVVVGGEEGLVESAVLLSSAMLLASVVEPSCEAADVGVTVCDVMQRGGVTGERCVLLLRMSVLEAVPRWLDVVCDAFSRPASLLDVLSSTQRNQLRSSARDTWTEVPEREVDVEAKLGRGFGDRVSIILVLPSSHPDTSSILESHPPLTKHCRIIAPPIDTPVPSLVGTINSTIASQIRHGREGQHDTQSTANAMVSLLPSLHPLVESRTLCAPTSGDVLAMGALAGRCTDQCTRALSGRLQMLLAGTAQLKAAGKAIDSLKVQLQGRHAELMTAQSNASTAMETISLSMQRAAARKEEAAQIRSDLAVEREDIQRRKADADRDLLEVRPMLEAAEKAVQGIPQDKLAELKAYSKPPPPVARVMEAVCLLLGEGECEWKTIKKILMNKDFKNRVGTFDPRSVSSRVINKVDGILTSNSDCFDPARISRVSKAAAPLAGWVKATVTSVTVTKKVAPLEKAVREAEGRLVAAANKLTDIEAEIAQIDVDTDRLRKEFQEKTSTALALKQSLSETTATLERGTALLSSLSSEGERWEQGLSTIRESMSRVAKTAAEAAVYAVVAGPLPDDARGVRSRVGVAGAMGVDRGLIRGLLVSDAALDVYREKGLPDTVPAAENAGILSLCLARDSAEAEGEGETDKEREQRRALDYVPSLIVCVGGDDVTAYLKQWLDKPTVVQPGETLASAAAVAARFGQSLIVTDVADAVPPCIVPFFSGSREVRSESGAYSVRLGPGRVVDVDPAFRVVLVSPAPLAVPPSIPALQLNFMATVASITDTFTRAILARYAPDLQALDSELRLSIRQLNSSLNAAEEDLLAVMTKASESDVPLLENAPLFEALSQAKAQTSSIKESRAQADTARQAILEAMGEVEPLAEAAARAHGVVEAMGRIHPAYAADPAALLTECLSTALDTSLIGQGGKEMVPKRGRYPVDRAGIVLFQELALRLLPSVFAADRATVAVLLLQAFQPAMCSAQLLSFFTEASGTSRQRLELLGQALRPGLLSRTGLISSSEWSLFAKDPGPAPEALKASTWPKMAAHLSPLERAAVVCALWPERTSAAVLSAARAVFEREGTYTADWDAALERSSVSAPLVALCVAGADPTSDIQQASARAGVTLLEVAVGGGDVQKVVDTLKKAYASGNTWVLVKNAHLNPSLLDMLPGLLRDLRAGTAQRQRERERASEGGFKVAVTTQLRHGLPSSLMRMCVRVCVDSTVSVQSNVSSILSSLASRDVSPATYSLAVLHSVLLARKEYQPRGVSRVPRWGQADMETLLSALQTRLAKTGGSSQDLWAVRGIVEEAIYGGPVMDSADRQLLHVLVSLAFQSISLHAASSLPTHFPIIQHLTPPATSPVSIDRAQTHCDRTLPLSVSPAMLGLDADAFKAPGVRLYSTLRRGLVAALSHGAALGTQRYEAVHKLSALHTRHEGAYTKARAMLQSMSGKAQSPLAEALLADLSLCLSLCSTVASDLSSAVQSVTALTAGEIDSMPVVDKTLCSYIARGCVPDHWTRGIICPPCPSIPISDPTMPPTECDGTPEGYMGWLLDSVEAVCKAVTQGDTLPIALTPRPATVLAAAKRHAAQRMGVPFTTLVCEVHMGVLRSDAVGITVPARQVSLFGCRYGSSGVALGAGTQGALPAMSLVYKREEERDRERERERRGTVQSVSVPLYVDRERTVLVGGLEAVALPLTDRERDRGRENVGGLSIPQAKYALNGCYAALR